MTKEVTMEGKLREFSEMGGRGTPIWTVSKGGDLYYLKSGDLLTIFSDASKKNVAWQGTLDLVSSGMPYPEPNLVQANITLDKWREFFRQGCPVEAKLKNPEKLVF